MTSSSASTPATPDYWKDEELSPEDVEDKEQPQEEKANERSPREEVKQKLMDKAQRDIHQRYLKAMEKRKKDDTPLPEYGAIIDQVEKSFALKQPMKLRYNPEKPKGRRLEKVFVNDKPWESRSLSSFLLEKSRVGEYSYFMLNQLRLIVSKTAIEEDYARMVGLSEDELRTFKSNFEVFTRNCKSMENARGGGAYCIVDEDGNIYSGFSKGYKVRRQGHKALAVNRKHRAREAAGSDRKNWDSFAVFCLDDDECYLSSYSIETLLNLTFNTTGPEGLNVNAFDCVQYGCIATDEQVEAIWSKLCTWLKVDPSRYLHDPYDSQPHAFNLWSDVDCAPLRPLTIWEIVTGLGRRRLHKSLTESNPLPSYALRTVPANLLVGAAKQERKDRRQLDRIVGPLRPAPKTITETNKVKGERIRAKRQMVEEEQKELEKATPADDPARKVKATFGDYLAKKKAKQG